MSVPHGLCSKLQVDQAIKFSDISKCRLSNGTLCPITRSNDHAGWISLSFIHVTFNKCSPSKDVHRLIYLSVITPGSDQQKHDQT